MPTLQSILAEVQAIDSTQVDAATAAIAQVVTDLNTLIAAGTPAADPVVSVQTTTQSGVTTTFVPEVPKD
jgi:hypothetical protein